MVEIATLGDTRAVEAEMPVEARWTARTVYQQLCQTAARCADRPALTFQLRSGPRDKAVRLDWSELAAEVTRLANLLHRLGMGPDDTLAYILPNGVEAPVALLAGATVGRVAPINPLLAPDHMAGLLREIGARMVLTLTPFPKSEVAQTVAAALELAPAVEVVLEVDLARYLAPPLKWIAPLLRPKLTVRDRARRLPLAAEMARERADRLDFAEPDPDRVCALFHTGGTTGMPKIAQHRAQGMLYNGWCGQSYLFTEKDVLLCPLPMFHVFAAYPVFLSCVMSGAQMVMVTPQGYRGEGVFTNFWKLVERWKVSFIVMVPTAAARLMQVPIDADISSLRMAFCGSAPMPVHLFQRFEAATGTRIFEGYGLTESTCLVAVNPPHGERRVGSVGLPFAYTDVRILDCAADGSVRQERATDEVGEICVKSPGVNPETYADAAKNAGMLTETGYLRTGDLGRIDAQGYLWITGRAKDLIIRGGHNIDPALIEEALMRHPDVAFAGAIGQPDAHSGEVPAAYLELVAGSTTSVEALFEFARAQIHEPPAMPKHIEILGELPKTAVGKIFKPDLRRRAITRVFDAALSQAGCAARVVEVREDSRIGLVAVLDPGAAGPDSATVSAVLGDFATPWRWREGA